MSRLEATHKQFGTCMYSEDATVHFAVQKRRTFALTVKSQSLRHMMKI